MYAEQNLLDKSTARLITQYYRWEMKQNRYCKTCGQFQDMPSNSSFEPLQCYEHVFSKKAISHTHTNHGKMKQLLLLRSKRPGTSSNDREGIPLNSKKYEAVTLVLGRRVKNNCMQ